MKFKEFSKKYLIGFVTGIIVCGTVSVIAMNYFPSSQTTYDNTASGMTATDVQEAIDELYTVCSTPSLAGDIILDDVDIVSSGDGLYEDEYEDGRYIYKGKNPNNYVTFNNQSWRIISIESDKTIKIMKNTSIGDRVWDNSDRNGNNNWSRPADLNTYLNSTYYNNLSKEAQSQIVAKEFSIGAVAYNDTSLSNSINSENSKKWNGKVALITASEYIRSNSNQESCGTMSKTNDNYSSCKNTTWMRKSNLEHFWTLSPCEGSTYFTTLVYLDGRIGYSIGGTIYTGDTSAVRPVLYLSTDVKITGGDGSQSNPYTIE